MFIIPCKFDKNYPVIFECINSILNFHPEEKIVLVDSFSEDRGYFNDLDKSVEIYDAENKHYALEAYRIGYVNNQNEDFYYCIHDSLILKNNIDFVKQKELTTIRWWDCPPVPMGRGSKDEDLTIWADQQLRQHVGFGVPFSYKGIFGPMFLASQNAMKKFYQSGIFNILPNDKYQSCATERLAGIVFGSLGYDVTNSLQGPMGDFYGSYDETFVQKKHLLRM